MSEAGIKTGSWPTPPDLWRRLKPEARRMRGQPATAESVLWETLRNRKLIGFRFRRQHAVGRFIVDFYCADSKLVVEVDGPIHQGSREEDRARDAFLESHGLSVMRFTNERVEEELANVLTEIGEALMAEAGGQ